MWVLPKKIKDEVRAYDLAWLIAAGKKTGYATLGGGCYAVLSFMYAHMENQKKMRNILYWMKENDRMISGKEQI